MLTDMGCESAGSLMQRLGDEMNLSFEGTDLQEFGQRRVGEPCAFGLAFGIEQPGLVVGQFVNFPASVQDIKSVIESHLPFAQKYLEHRAMDEPVVDSWDQLLAAQNCQTISDLVTWLDEDVIKDEVWFKVSPFTWEEPSRIPPVAGIHVFMNCSGSVAHVWLDFPLSVPTLVTYLGELSGLVEAGFWRVFNPGSEWFSGDAFIRFPFLREEADAFGERFAHQLARCDTQREVELLASGWAEARLQTVMDELGAGALSLLELDQKEAVDELTQRAVEYASERPVLAVTRHLPESLFTDRSQSEVLQVDSAPRLAERDLPAAPAVESQTSGGNEQSTSSSSDASLGLLADSPLGRRPHIVTSIVSALMLLLALNEHPYGYYVVLRWVVCLSAILVVWVLLGWRSAENEAELSGWEVGVLAFTVIAITFNPLVPIALDRGTWAPIDFLAFVVFGVSIFGVSRPHQRAARPRG